MTRAILTVEEDKRRPMSQQISRWVDQVLGPSFHQYCPGEVWRPAVNIYEDQTHYCVVVDLAGMNPEEIDLRVDKGVLLLSGDRPVSEMPDAGGMVRLHLMEIDHGRFCREIRLPENADIESTEAVAATYRCGLLWIKIPKNP
jgi:HSP20 family protein